MKEAEEAGMAMDRAAGVFWDSGLLAWPCTLGGLS